MSLDTTKLENVKQKAGGGKITARCPACKARGGDVKGEHLFVNTDGKYGCVAHPRDKQHNKTIFAAVGVKDDTAATPIIQIRRLVIPESTVVTVIGSLKKKVVVEATRISGNSAADEAMAA